MADLIQFKTQLDDILRHAVAPAAVGETIRDAASWHEKFTDTLREQFEHFINRRQNKPAELLSSFLDERLRTGKQSAAAATSSSGSVERIETTLDHALTLFRYIRGKDIFEAFYKKDLARRLLSGKSASVDLERSMLNKLRAECGVSITRALYIIL